VHERVDGQKRLIDGDVLLGLAGGYQAEVQVWGSAHGKVLGFAEQYPSLCVDGDQRRSTTPVARRKLRRYKARRSGLGIS
jgi:hypothetical protein